MAHYCWLAKATMMEAIHDRTRKFSTFCLEMQVSCRVYSEIQEKIFVRQPSPLAWDRSPGAGVAEGVLCGGWEDGHLMPDHVHMLIAIPPKYSVASVVGYIKGKSSIWVARNWYGRVRNYTGQAFWARGYYVSTVGRDEAVIREYITNQEQRDMEDDRQLGISFPT